MATERSVLVRLKANVNDFVRGIGTAQAAVKGLTSEIDTSNDRTAYLAQGLLALGPATAPLGAAAVPVFSGLATQLTVAALAAGTAGLAFNGVGDALGALNDYQLDPTEAHLKKMNETMAKVGPSGAQFVKFLDGIGPQFSALANTARDGLFPGVEAGINNLLELLPQVERIVGATADTLGDLAEAGGAGLAGPRFAEFFDFLETDAQPILAEMGRTIGNLVDGFAAMLVAFAPLSRDFSSGFEEMSKSFADWAHGLEDAESFEHFVEYIREAGPKVRELLGAMSEALVALVQAAAPVGDLMLPIFTSLFEIIAKIAESDLGPFFVGAAAAIGLYGRAVAIASVTTGGFFGKILESKNGIKAQGKAAGEAAKDLNLFGRNMKRATFEVGANGDAVKRSKRGLKEFAKEAGPAAATAGIFALNMTGVADKMNLSNTATLAMIGTLGGPWGAAIGAAAGGILDLTNALSFTGEKFDKYQQDLLGIAGSDVRDQIRVVTEEIEKQQQIADNANIHLNLGFTDIYSSDKAAAAADKVGGLKKLLKELEDQSGEVRAVTRDLTYEQELNTAQSRKQAEAFIALRAAGQATGDQFITLGGDVDNAKVSLEQWITQLEQQAQALTEFGDNAKKASDRGLRQGLIKALEDAGPAGALRLRQLANATDAEIERANKAWRRGQKAIKDYQAVLTGIPEVYVTNFNLTGADKATADLRKIFQAVTSIPRKWRTDYLVNQINSINKGRPGSGGTDRDPSTPWASGGWTGPGEKYAPAGIVHADEFVFSKEATHGNVAYLSQLHAEMRGYASGGYVSPSSGMVSLSDGDISRLASAMLRARPVHGDVHISGDPTVYRREMQQDRARASLTGMRPTA